MDELLTQTLIPNTTMHKHYNTNNVFTGYKITPNDGYVLHDKQYDQYEDYDENGEPIGNPILGYRTSTASCAANYDFTANPREFYAVLASEVPADQIFGVTDKPEIA